MDTFYSTTKPEQAYTMKSTTSGRRMGFIDPLEITVYTTGGNSFEYHESRSMTFFVVFSHGDLQTWHVLNPDTGELVQIDPEQRWFWTEEWQAREREADEDLANGRYEEFDDFEDFINSL